MNKGMSASTGLGQMELLLVLFVQLLHLFGLFNCSFLIAAFNLYSLTRIVVLISVPRLRHARAVADFLFLHRYPVLFGEVALLLAIPLPQRILDFFHGFLIVAIASVVFAERCVPSPEPESQPERVVLRQRRRTRGEDERILELIEQSYMLYRQADLQPPAGYSLVYANRKARDLVVELDCEGDGIADYFSKSDDPKRGLRDFISEAFTDSVPIGSSIKVQCSLLPQRGPTDGGESATSKIVPFRFYRAVLWRLSRTDVLLTLAEQLTPPTLSLVRGIQGAIVRTLSHELRTLANGIIGNVELISDDAGLSAEQRVHRNLALCSSHLLGSRLNDLFDYIQLQNGGFKPHYKEFVLDEMCQDIRLVCSAYAIEKQLSFSIKKKGALPRAMVGDSERIEQILLNLLSKAIEFTEYGHIVLSIQRGPDRQIVFKITSIGSSMQQKLEEQMKNLLPTTKKRLSVLQNADNNAHAGTIENLEALSLEISQIICREIGTRIVTKNVTGKSSQFRFAVTDGFPGKRKRSGAKNPAGVATTNRNSTLRPGRSKAFKRCASTFTNKDGPEDTRSDHSGSAEEGKQQKDMSRSALDKEVPPDSTPKGKRKNSCLCVPPSRKSDLHESALVEDIPDEIKSTSPINLPQATCKPLMTELVEGASTSTLVTTGLRGKAEEVKHSPTLPTRFVSRRPSLKNFRFHRITRAESPNRRSRKPYMSKNMDDVEKCSVLVVDDDAINRLVLKSLLKKHGYNSIEARDGKEAVSLIDCYIKTNKLHELMIIFMDLQMPVMNGIVATERIQELCEAVSVPPPTIIGVTADPLESDRQLFIKAGISELVYKPLDTRKVLNCVNKYIMTLI